MTEELISVVIPTYNREATIERAVRSALDQTGDFRLEVLVVDDGSTDGTRQRVEAVGDERVRFIAADHRGACAARNRGIREAKGTYVAFLDSDDTWRPGKLAAQTRLLAEREADAVACAFMHHEGEKEFVIPAATVGEGWVSYRSLLGENIISTQTLLGRTEVFRKNLFDEEFPRMQDWDFVIRLAKDFRVWFEPRVLADVYVQPDSISKKPALGARALRMLLWKYREDYFASEELFQHTLDEICRYATLADAGAVGEMKERLRELENVERERDWYRDRYNLIRHPAQSIGKYLKGKRKKQE